MALSAQPQRHSPDQQIFPDFDDNLRQAFQRETEIFVGSVMREDQSVPTSSTPITPSSMSASRSITESRTSMATSSAK